MRSEMKGGANRTQQRHKDKAAISESDIRDVMRDRSMKQSHTSELMAVQKEERTRDERGKRSSVMSANQINIISSTCDVRVRAFFIFYFQSVVSFL